MRGGAIVIEAPTIYRVTVPPKGKLWPLPHPHVDAKIQNTGDERGWKGRPFHPVSPCHHPLDLRKKFTPPTVFMQNPICLQIWLIRVTLNSIKNYGNPKFVNFWWKTREKLVCFFARPEGHNAQWSSSFRVGGDKTVPKSLEGCSMDMFPQMTKW